MTDVKHCRHTGTACPRGGDCVRCGLSDYRPERGHMEKAHFDWYGPPAYPYARVDFPRRGEIGIEIGIRGKF